MLKEENQKLREENQTLKEQNPLQNISNIVPSNSAKTQKPGGVLARPESVSQLKAFDDFQITEQFIANPQMYFFFLSLVPLSSTPKAEKSPYSPSRIGSTSPRTATSPNPSSARFSASTNGRFSQASKACQQARTAAKFPSRKTLSSRKNGSPSKGPSSSRSGTHT